MTRNHHILPIGVLAGAFIALSGTSAHAAAIITTGQTVTGTTTNLPLTVALFAKDTDVTISNDITGNLLYSFVAGADTDKWIQWSNLTSLNLDTATYKYVQVNFSSVTVGAVSGPWQSAWQDDDSTIGGGTNSLQSIGTGVVGTVPFSVVIDMTAFTGANGGTTGTVGWGGGILDKLRLDMFESTSAATNAGKVFTISSVTLGSALVPEPGAALLGCIGMLTLLRRRRR